MGSTVSLPEPFLPFALFSVGDVDGLIHAHKNQFGTFMITQAQLAQMLGGSKHAKARAASLSAQLGSGGRVNALAFLCGVVACSRPAALPGRGDAVAAKARRVFDLFDLSRRGALGAAELSILLLSVARALESFLRLGERGRGSHVFKEADSAVFVGLEGLDAAAKFVLQRPEEPKADTPEEDSARSVGEDLGEPQMDRERFADWCRRLLGPSCRPPAVLDALRGLAQAAADGDRAALMLPPASREAEAAEAAEAFAAGLFAPSVKAEPL